MLPSFFLLMLVNIMMWRQRIGTFKCIKLSKSETDTGYSLRVFVSSLYFVFSAFCKSPWDYCP